jgi:NDP-4-keto-2,6-dideoxyhexose 3-C-methyltransferase
MPHEWTRCRICGHDSLVPILELGVQTLTGVFPRDHAEPLTRGPLDLVKCHAEGERIEHCGLVQLRHSYPSGELYGASYGYRSSLNRSMVDHLGRIVARLREAVTLRPGDLVLDVGSNDGTLLSFYPESGPVAVGIDPTAANFRQYYPPHARVIPEFFSAALWRRRFGERQAKIVTAIAMLYDLDDPQRFVREVAEILAEDGVWHFEQSYLPAMLAANAYDTICHEHVEYYALRQIKHLTDRAGLKIIGVHFNRVNGGSFAVTAAKAAAPYPEDAGGIAAALAAERRQGLHTLEPYAAFKGRVFAHRDELRSLLGELRRRGELVLGYGASTKGNVILQFCGLTARDLPCFAEVNDDKFGRLTPGTHIPIVSESEARARRPDYFLVMPWHFRDPIVEREAAFLAGGGKLIFPLPAIEIVDGAGG